MLTVDNLSRSYGATKAVDSVSFAIKKGEIVGLLGRNGAGKTTIMKMLSGFLEPDQGEIIINGHDLAVQRKLAQSQIGYLPENLPIYPEMLVADYLDYAAELKGLKQNKYTEIKRVIAATDIGDKILAPIATLSRGFKQRVGVAQAVLGDPKLLILDEPTNGLDPTQTEHMRVLIRSIAKNATVILSTHIMQEVDALCDRALIIRSGQLALDAQLTLLRKSEHLLVETSLNPSMISEVANNINEIKNTELLASTDRQHYFQYRFHVPEQDNLVLRAAIAKRIMLNGGLLYSLSVERRDLDSVFREINEQHELTALEEVDHAA